MSLREIERASIRSFVESQADRLMGRVLDYGCGLQPYSDIVWDAGGRYEPYDRPGLGGSVVEEAVGKLELGAFDAVLCTQVIQYAASGPLEMLKEIRRLLVPKGWLVMTGPTNWPVVEDADLWRFTPSGIETLLVLAGFEFSHARRRGSVAFEGERWCLGWGAVARL